MVSDLNLAGKIQTIIVTKIISPEVLPPLPTPTKAPLDVDDDGRAFCKFLLSLDSMLIREMKVPVNRMITKG